MEAVASGLAAGAGLDKPGARVGVYSTNCREWMIAMQARPQPHPPATDVTLHVPQACCMLAKMVPGIRVF